MDENKERSLVAKVMDGLVSGIVEQKYGAILPPQDILSKEFDVSRTVMREALSMLLARHMLDVRPKTGTRIRPMSDWRLIDEDVVSWRFRAKPDQTFLRDVIEFRMLIEPRAAALAAARATPDEIAGIRDAFDTLSRLQVGEPEYQAADEVLHTRIVAASGNQFFRQMTAIVRGALVTVNPIVDGIESVREATLAAQKSVVEAIESKDPAAAERATRELVDLAAEEVGRAFSLERMSQPSQPVSPPDVNASAGA
ncbi:FCD domain-containing protein [Caballeronia sp. LZ062]|uniref:FadR/GntR family transcriptional regulator n=1 Tax=unclassified Caballeronia TaxID=2646786 RepID=UPI00285FF1D1|nr:MULTISPECIES: FCD domain-containing protein [unclassified Caballeronia]MDR5854707.1 FCD domain-containing protein [Caballeronia sp. LZ050]MDR5870764.1 FCD domain-containing protein [Caballeronia sp. LZ062]